MKAVKWTLAAVVFFVIALIWQLPAAVVLGQITLPPQVDFKGVSGSIWHGELSSVTVQGVRFDSLSWQLHPLSLLSGHIALSVHSRPGVTRLSGELAASFSGKVSVDNLLVRTPVAPLVAGVRLPVPSQVGGDLAIAITHFTQGVPWCESLAGKAQWLNASVSNHFGNFNLGRIDADLGCDKGVITSAVHDQPPQLGLQLEARLEARRYQVRGFAKPAADLPKNLKSIFDFFGRPHGDGRYPLQFQGPLPR